MDRISDQATLDVYNDRSSGPGRRALPKDLWSIAQRKLDFVLAASNLAALSSPPSNRLKKLDGDLAGMWSIRINDQYRIVFCWTEDLRAHHVRICDYH